MSIAAQGLTVDYRRGAQRVRALAGVSLTVGAGESVAVLGSNGSGKSTLLQALRGLVPASSGAVFAPAAAGNWGGVSLVMQRPESTIFGETVERELVFGPQILGAPVADQQQLARAALAAVGLELSALERDPLALSGGEQRRIAIAAALAMRPRVLLLDEPTAGLDARSRMLVLDALRGLARAGGSVLMTTHNLDDALYACGRTVVLHQGRVAFEGPTTVLADDPALCLSLGVTPIVSAHVAWHVAQQTSTTRPVDSWREDVAVDYIARVASASSSLGELLTSSGTFAPITPSAPQVGRRPWALDGRYAIAAAGLIIAAAFVPSLLGLAILLVTTLAWITMRRVPGRRTWAALRPVLVVLVLVGTLQMLLAPDASTPVGLGLESDQPAARAALRVLQITIVVLATFALTATVATAELARGFAWYLRPLAIFRVRVQDLGMLLATSLGFVTLTEQSLEQLRKAQRARGLDAAQLGVRARLGLRTALIVPLLVLSFRHAATTADAMRVRGYVRGQQRSTWRPAHAGRADVLVLLAAAAVAAGAVVLR